MLPGVAVVIPCTDRVEHFRECIYSVLSQNYEGAIRIYLVENNSREKSKLAYFLNEAFPHRESIIHIYLIDCENANQARNFGILISVEPFIAFLDSDDEWQPFHLADSIKNLMNTGGAASYSGYTINNSIGYVERPSRPILFNENPVAFLFEGGGFAQSSSFVLRRKVFSSISWDNSLKRAQDYDFFIKVQYAHSWKFSGENHVILNRSLFGRPAVDYLSHCRFFKRYEGEMTVSAKNRFILGLLSDYSWSDKRDFYSLKENFLTKCFSFNVYIFSLNYWLARSFSTAIKLKTALSVLFKKRYSKLKL